MKKNIFKRLDIASFLSIIILTVYNSFLLINKFENLLEYINIITINIFFLALGYFIYKKNIRYLYYTLRKIFLFFLLSTIVQIIFHSIPNLLKQTITISNLITVNGVIGLFKCKNIYNGISILFILFLSYILEFTRRKKTLFNKILGITIIICTIITKNTFILCLFLYEIGRLIREKNIANKISKKKLLLLGIITTIVFFIEKNIYESTVYISGILLSCEMIILTIKYKKIKLDFIKINIKQQIIYILAVMPVLNYIIIDLIINNLPSKKLYEIVCVLVTNAISFVIVECLYIFNKKIKKIKDRKKKSCLVIGYMNNNFGDDLFFKILFDRYKNVDFYMYPPSHLLNEYQEKFLHNKNVIFYEEEEEYQRLLEDTHNSDKKYEDIRVNIYPLICHRAEKVDFYVNIGGSIFIQDDNWKNDDRFKLKEIMKDKPSFIIGCNFGPGNDEYYEYYKNWFKGFNDICFREQESYQKFKDLENARLADDIVLVYTEKHIFHPFGYNRNIGISVLEPANTKKLKKQRDLYYNFITSTIKHYISKGFKIKLYAFCSNEGDLEAAYNVARRLSNEELKHLEIVEYKKNIKKSIRKWKQCKYIIGTRFHSNILAIAYGQSFLPIIYSDKTYNYLKNIDESIDIYSLKELGNMKKENFIYNNVTLNYSSEDQFIIMDNYLKG